MALLRSSPQIPLPWGKLLLWVAGLWIAPVPIGWLGLALFGGLTQTSAEVGLGLWFAANALTFSPLFSWIGWLIALPPVALALQKGWFGWAVAAAIGIIAGSIAGAVADTELALPFGLVAVLILRAVLGRVLPL